MATIYNFNWFPAAGTLMIFAGIITAAILKVSPGTALKTYGETYVELKSAILTVMAVLALAYVMNLSGQTAALGAWLAGAGTAFAILSPILGWLGVAVTGSDTSANALFGALQVQTAAQAGLDPVLMAAANTSGGVLGKMISPQNLAIAAAAVGMAGKEGDIFRKVVGLEPAAAGLHVRARRAAGHPGAVLDGALTQKARLRPSTAAGFVRRRGAAFLRVRAPSAEELGLLRRELRLGEDALLLELAELLELGDDVDRWRGRSRRGSHLLLVRRVALGGGLGVLVGELGGLASLHATADGGGGPGDDGGAGDPAE